MRTIGRTIAMVLLLAAGSACAATIQDEFNRVIEKLAKFLADGYVDRFESAEIVDMLGRALAQLGHD